MPPEFLPLHVDEVPEYEVRGDCLHVQWRSLEMFIPIPIAQAAIGRATHALDVWYQEKGLVLPFRQDIAAE